MSMFSKVTLKMLINNKKLLKKTNKKRAVETNLRILESIGTKIGHFKVQELKLNKF